MANEHETYLHQRRRQKNEETTACACNIFYFSHRFFPSIILVVDHTHTQYAERWMKITLNKQSVLYLTSLFLWWIKQTLERSAITASEWLPSVLWQRQCAKRQNILRRKTKSSNNNNNNRSTKTKKINWKREKQTKRKRAKKCVFNTHGCKTGANTAREKK